MRILVTNDDGVFAPGIAALARGLVAALGEQHELVVVAPLVDHSGAGAAVGPVYERESIPYETVEIPGLSDVPTLRDRGSAGPGRDPGLHRGIRPPTRPGGLRHQPRHQRRAVGAPLGHGRGHADRRPVRNPGSGRQHRLGRGPGPVGDAGVPGRRPRAGHGRPAARHRLSTSTCRPCRSTGWPGSATALWAPSA